ncbi:cbb3-type cytochrome c oxidase subunit I [Sulfuricurvum sp. PD_MW2]|uniref:cbb3-type cytochrome c oxidase subunit I n=1 Tax=Sulfuricurvum sp. PD_MW2 TaxID=2027917 RepID=UPI0025FBDC1D|nr:cbb3-type cytochrome c oxidase subunit I [Sulfuricurvum sp. PD_MW2]
MLNKFIDDELPLALFWLILGLFAGLVYAMEILGLDGSMSLLSPERARSLHISQMLYGFFPLMLSLLPFALFQKEGVLSQNAIVHLRRYFVVWNLFLLFMSMALLFGNIRGLPFYDFPYQLNFLLAFSGVFYLFALLDALRRYAKRPLWVNVSLAAVIVAPLALIVLMNPQYGQVEKTLIGPHGDNTLGMSFALIPIYYLLIKLVAIDEFKPRWHGLWIVPLVGYIVSLVIRNFFHTLSYTEEWFFQYLTLLYVPLLWIWLRDAGVSFKTNPYLILSIIAFIFVDIEGNFLFIPDIRALIHRNDLVVGHAHIAMGLGVAFMALAIVHHLLPNLFRRIYAIAWSVLMGIMAVALSIAGILEARGLNESIEPFLWVRALVGAMIVGVVLRITFDRLKVRIDSAVKVYHLSGFLSDAGGGAVLILGGSALFSLLGFHFSGTYEYIVFAFMIGTGLTHWYGLYSVTPYRFAELSASIRAVCASVFAALYMAGTLDGIALLVALYDISFALLYWLFLRGKD